MARVGRPAFVRQYAGLVDPANYEWAVDRWYTPNAIEALLAAAQEDPGAHFIVAEVDGDIAGFLHYDESGLEPELHRLYVSDAVRGHGIGGALIETLHDRLGLDAAYVLAVVEGNDDAVRFYARHGLEERARVSGHEYYRETAGLEFPAGAEDFTLVLMTYR